MTVNPPTPVSHDLICDMNFSQLRIAPMNHRQQAHNNCEKQVWGCKVDVIIPTNLVYVHFGPPIPTSSFNFMVFYTFTIYNEKYFSERQFSYIVCVLIWRV